MSIMDSREEKSKHQGSWLATIGGLQVKVSTARYSDGSGVEGHAVPSSCTMSRRDEPTILTSANLSPLATSGDAELLGILLSLQSTVEKDHVLLLSDSQTSNIHVHKLIAETQTPHSGIENEIKRLLLNRVEKHLDTGIA